MLDTISIDELPATSIITIRRLKSLGIKTYWDLLNYFPFRYEDYSLISPVGKLQEGEVVTITGQIIDSQQQIIKTGLRIQKFILEDKTGKIELNWYNQPYLLKLLKPGMTISVAGQVKRFGRKLTMDPLEYEIGKPNIHTGRILPIYPEKRGLSSRTIREKIFYLLSEPSMQRSSKNGTLEFLPKEILSYNQLIDEVSAYYNIHFPKDKTLAKKARERLAFNELFLLQLNAALIRRGWEKEKVGHPFVFKTHHYAFLQKFIDNLPFQLTEAQKKVWREILHDLQQKKPMNRLLQGDVGSGKTVVAALACYLAYLNGFQSLFMAPTEILAQQHYRTITELFRIKSEIPKTKSETMIKIQNSNNQNKNVLNFQNSNLEFVSNFDIRVSNLKTPKICLVTSSSKPSPKELKSADIIIGTHALIQKKISFEKVGLVVIDEQHRFGVTQRAMLKEKGLNPHLLTMTATPIPRTVALTLYGELDISIIDEMPKGRLPVKTFIVPKIKRNDCYQWVKSQIIGNNAQVFIICPLIEESAVETMKSVKAATKEYQFLKEKIFPEFSLGLLHGKMKAKEKEQVMKNFKEKKYHILVATPVVEVGIDVEAATIMIIEGGERFGLAQLHQLRGRVGRGDKQSYCFIFSDSNTSEVIKRLEFFAKTTNGNLLAEKDLEIRGPGNIYGTQQHGIIELKIASLSDFPLIEKTKNAVKYFLSKYNIEEFKPLKKRVEEYKIEQIAKD